jgi:fructose-1,6-bisphosphatase/inositol monophosphatase family enzyme
MMEEVSLAELLSPKYMVDEILGVHRFVRSYIEEMPQEAFMIRWIPAGGGKKKPLAVVDALAEDLFAHRIARRFGGKNVRVIGEEKLNEEIDLEQEQESRICLLVDMIDGTDLLQRDFSNWCSAVVVFDPQKVEILAAFVALPRDSLYFATRDGEARKKRLSDARDYPSVPLRGPAVDKGLTDSSICMYAQKCPNLRKLLELGQNEQFVEWLKENERVDEELKRNADGEVGFRFYNLAGNPMMVRLADGVVDIVLDLKGQAPHDMVAGAFISVKAGATLAKLTGEPLLVNELEQSLLRPGRSQVKYVLAAQEGIVKEIAKLRLGS